MGVDRGLLSLSAGLNKNYTVDFQIVKSNLLFLHILLIIFKSVVCFEFLQSAPFKILGNDGYNPNFMVMQIKIRI